MPDLRLYNLYEFDGIFVSSYANKLYKHCQEQGKWNFREFLDEIIREFHAELWDDNTTVTARFNNEADLVHFQMVWG